jgi:hypothetical protein
MSSRARVLGVFAVCLGLLAIAIPAAAGDRWELLGKRVVNDRLDHDEIVVTAARGDWEALKLKVHRAPVRFYDMKVHYGNGAVDDIPIRAVIARGGESRVIDLRGNDRVIRKVTFTYDAKTLGRKRAEVRLFGRR